MKKIILIIFPVLFLIGCAASVNTANMAADERFDYAMKLYNNRDYDESVKEFEAIVMQFPGDVVVDKAQYYIGMSRYNRKEYILAAYEFSKLVNNMTGSELVPDGQFMLADCYYQLSPDFTLDQQYTKKAIQEFQTFVDIFPTNARVQDADNKINEMNLKLAQKEYNNAYIYEKMEYYNAALFYYNNVIDTYHDTKYAPLAMYNRIKIFMLRDRNKEALAEAEKFLDRYPDDKNYKEVAEIKSTLSIKYSNK